MIEHPIVGRAILQGRLLGVDFGLKRVGLAVSDAEGRLAVGAGRLEGLAGSKLSSQVIKIAQEREITSVVVGEPDATRGNEAVTEGARFLAQALQRSGLNVSTWPEGYTTASALTARKFYGGKKGSDKGWADEAAAIILLQDYLDWVRGQNG